MVSKNAADMTPYKHTDYIFFIIIITSEYSFKATVHC